MAGITLETAETQLAAWLAASTATASGQSVTMDGDTITKADASKINAQIIFWNNMVKSLDRGGIRVRGITPA